MFQQFSYTRLNWTSYY